MMMKCIIKYKVSILREESNHKNDSKTDDDGNLLQQL